MTGSPGTQFWQDLLESLPDPVAVRDPAARLVWVNDAYAALVGRDRVDIVGLAPEEMWPPDIAARLHQRVAEVIAADTPATTMEHWAAGADSMDVLITNTAVAGPAGPLVVSIVRNLTELRELGAAFHDRERVYQNLFERVGDGVFVVDLETMRFTQFNTAAHAALGYSRAEFAELAVPDIQGESAPEWVQARMAEIDGEWGGAVPEHPPAQGRQPAACDRRQQSGRGLGPPHAGVGRS